MILYGSRAKLCGISRILSVSQEMEKAQLEQSIFKLDTQNLARKLGIANVRCKDTLTEIGTDYAGLGYLI